MKAYLRKGAGHSGIYFVKDDMDLFGLARITGHQTDMFISVTKEIDIDYKFCKGLFKIFECPEYHYLNLDIQ